MRGATETRAPFRRIVRNIPPDCFTRFPDTCLFLGSVCAVPIAKYFLFSGSNLRIISCSSSFWELRIVWFFILYLMCLFSFCDIGRLVDYNLGTEEKAKY